MTKLIIRLTKMRPIVYGIIYLSLIPLYAIVFSFLPEDSLLLNNHDRNFFSNIYFSIITITTLGFGDITPLGKIGQLLTASEAILGVILTGLFLNSLSHQHGIEVQEYEKQKQIEENKKQAIQRFAAYNQLIEVKIKRYIIYSIPVTTPLDKRKDFNNLNENFCFNDMQDLFKTTLRLTDNHFTPAVEYYFKNLKELVNSLEELVKFGYIQEWLEIEKLCIEFIETSKELDFSSYILNQPNTKIGDKTGAEFDVEMIKKHKGEVKYLPSNSINAYVALFNLLRESFKFIKKYKQLASEIIEDKKIKSVKMVIRIEEKATATCEVTNCTWSGCLIFMDDLQTENIQSIKGFRGFRYKWW